jgi:hypothetical protein
VRADFSFNENIQEREDLRILLQILACRVVIHPPAGGSATVSQPPTPGIASQAGDDPNVTCRRRRVECSKQLMSEPNQNGAGWPHQVGHGFNFLGWSARMSRNSPGPLSRRRFLVACSSAEADWSVSRSISFAARSAAFEAAFALVRPAGLPMRPRSASRTMAAGRVGLSACRARQSSTATRKGLWQRRPTNVPLPVVAGRSGLRGRVFFAIFCDPKESALHASCGCYKYKRDIICEKSLAPWAGVEPATFRLTVERSTAELPGNGAMLIADGL